MKRCNYLAVFAVLTATGIGTSNAAEPLKPLKVCDDDGGWPPFTFTDPKDPKKVIGAATDVIVEILKRSGYEAQVTLVPWKRCLAEVESGETAMLMNAAYNDERAKTYLMSKPYYTLSSGLFYLTSKFPNKPDIKTQDDMKKYKYCGIAGYNYKMYPIPESQIDMGSKDEVSRFKKIRGGNCDIAVGDVEVLKAMAAQGTVDLKGFEILPVPGAKPKEFHAMISRAASGGEKLHKIIDDGLEKLKKDGTYAKIFKKYGI